MNNYNGIKVKCINDRAISLRFGEIYQVERVGDGYYYLVGENYGGVLQGRFEIVEENNMIKDFTKDMLVGGKHVVEFSDGGIGLIMGDWIQYIDRNNGFICGWDSLKSFTDDLLSKNSIYTPKITKIHEIEGGVFSGDIIMGCCSNVIWEREEKTEAQVELENAEELLAKAMERVVMAKKLVK